MRGEYLLIAACQTQKTRLIRLSLTTSNPNPQIHGNRLLPWLMNVGLMWSLSLTDMAKFAVHQTDTIIVLPWNQTMCESVVFSITIGRVDVIVCFNKGKRNALHFDVVQVNSCSSQLRCSWSFRMKIPMLRDCESEAKYSSRLVEFEFMPTTSPRTLSRAQQLQMAPHRSRATPLRKIRSQDATSNSSKLSRYEGVQPWQRLLPPRV